MAPRFDPRHLVILGTLLTAGAVAAAAGTSAVDRGRMANMRRELAALDTMALEPARMVEVRSRLAYHLAGLERSEAQRLSLRAPFLPVFALGALVLTVGLVLAGHARRSRSPGP